MARPAHKQGMHRKARNENNSVAAFSLYMDGMNFSQIARELDIDRSTARARVQRGIQMLKDNTTAKREFVDQEHIKDLGDLSEIATSEAVEVKDRIAAYNARTRVLERYAKTNGLDMPVKTDVTTDGEKITIIMNPDRLPAQAAPQQ